MGNHSTENSKNAPRGYSRYMGWWFPNGTQMPLVSTMPHPTIQGEWQTKTFESNFMSFNRHVQGWKLHVGVHPAQRVALFDAIAPTLRRLNVYHKFLPYETASNQDISKEAFQRLQNSNKAEGKNCAIYPADPNELALVVKELDKEIKAYRKYIQSWASTLGDHDFLSLPPFPGGTKGNLPVGESGLISTRYGCFSGPRNKVVYNPNTDKYERDLRYMHPFPEFANNIPTPINALINHQSGIVLDVLAKSRDKIKAAPPRQKNGLPPRPKYRI